MVGQDAQMAFGLIVNKPIASVLRGRVFGGLGISGAEGTGGVQYFLMDLFSPIWGL